MGDWTDPLYRLRYGVTSADKARLAASGAVPGAQPVGSEQDIEREDRRASAYLFAREHPGVAGVVQPIVDDLRLRAFGDSPQVVAVAQQGQEAAIGKPTAAQGVGTKVLRGIGSVALGGVLTSWDSAAAHFFGPGKP
jgi:hypothetical protein